MIVCTKCLQRNEDDAEFCISCGTYLDWSSNRPPPASRRDRSTVVPTRTSEEVPKPARARRSSTGGDGARRAPSRKRAATPPAAGAGAGAKRKSSAGSPAARARSRDTPRTDDGAPGAPDDGESAALAVAARRLRERAEAGRLQRSPGRREPTASGGDPRRRGATAGHKRVQPPRSPPPAAAARSARGAPTRRTTATSSPEPDDEAPSAPSSAVAPETPGPTALRPVAPAAPGGERFVEAEPETQAKTEPRTGPGPEQPRAVHPGETPPRPPRQAVADEDFAVHPGDVRCPRCGAGNAPSRFFCRRCGGALREDDGGSDLSPPAVAAPARRSWWWRLRHRAEEVPDTPAVPPGWQARVRSALPVFLVLGLIAGMLGPWREPITQRLEAARKRLAPRYENVYPAKVEASTALPDHPAPAAADRAPNTYWAEDGPTNGENEGLIFTFDRPVDLGRIGFYNGAQTKPQDFLAQPRLRDVLITFDDDDQRTSLTLKDDDAFQSYEIEAKQVTTLIVLIESVYLSPQGGTAASIGEVEFFTKH